MSRVRVHIELQVDDLAPVGFPVEITATASEITIVDDTISGGAQNMPFGGTGPCAALRFDDQTVVDLTEGNLQTFDAFPNGVIFIGSAISFTVQSGGASSRVRGCA